MKTIVASGPTAERYDMVILGDGYQASEEARFDRDCQQFAQALFRQEPFQTYLQYINIHTVFRASVDSGADHPDATPPIFRNTVYNATYNVGGTPRCLSIQNATQAAMDAALAPATEGRVLVFVNDPRYGGCASQFAVSYNGGSMTQVQIHELGHSIGGLADEYDYPSSGYSGPEPSEVNATKSSTGNKWSRWFGVSGISAFEGCKYHQTGLFRPRADCLMRNLGQPLCAVCQENLVLKLHVHASAIHAPQPAATALRLFQPAQQEFSFTNIAPVASGATVTWQLDGVPQPAAAGASRWTLDTTALAPGQHQVRLIVQDQTPIVRADPSGLLKQSRRWDLEVFPPGPVPDLQVAAFAASGGQVAAGGNLDLSTTVVNGGTGAAAPAQLEHFLSTDQVITSQDVFLGATSLASLGAGGTTSIVRNGVQIPSFARPGSYWLAAVVDRVGGVFELEEGNNVALTPVTIDAATGCELQLEFRDDLLYPKDRGTLHLGTLLSTVRPTVAAPCHAGQSYLLLWGCSGTTPGTPLPGTSLTLPLNFDLCTQVGLSLVNTLVFTQWFGPTDGAGIGEPIMIAFGLPYVGDVDTDLAAVVFDPALSSPMAVTPPVRLQLRQ
ncbi:MAG: M64 family metallopeptidase [Planctomycetota bacterium]